MASTRDELIAAWRQQLADAESAETEPSSRAAWLARLRQRLYHFLLSLYGEGIWNAPQAAEHDQTDQRQGTLVLDDENALPLAGKPAKAEDKIRAILQAVADNQDHRVAPGTLTAEKLSSQWFIVASRSSRLDLQRCQSLLDFLGINSRLRRTASDVYLEVPGQFHHDAIAILDRHLSDLRPRPRRSRRARTPRSLSSRIFAIAMLLLFLVPQLCLAALALEFSLELTVAIPLAFAAAIVVTLGLLSWRGSRRYRNAMRP